jgi:hypothetical protein
LKFLFADSVEKFKMSRFGRDILVSLSSFEMPETAFHTGNRDYDTKITFTQQKISTERLIKK